MRVAVLGAALACAAALSGCGVRLQASHLTVRIDAKGMHLVQVNGAPAGSSLEVPTGETVVDLINADTTSAHTVMLVQGFSEPAALPASVRQARLVSDDPERILDISESLDRDLVQFSAGGGVIDDPKTAQFHEYLAPGRPYMLLDPAHVAGYLVVHPVGAA